MRPIQLAFVLLLFWAGSAIWAGGANAEARERLSLEAIGSAFGFTTDDIEALRRGERVGGELTSVSQNELALSIGLGTTATPATLWDRAVSGKSIEGDPTVLQHGLIGEDAAASLASLTLPDEEIERLARAEPGDDVNFSTDEIETLRAIVGSKDDPDAQREALLTGFRRILAARLEAYRTGGLAAVVPYDRGGGNVGAPAVELLRALAEVRATKQLAPRAYDAIAKHPRPAAEGVLSRFYWILNEAQGEAITMLLHRVLAKRDGYIIQIDHRFYVSHTLNSMQAVGIAKPTERGAIVIYANRTFTDLVGGFGGALARGVGRTLMRSQMNEAVDAFERSLSP